MFTRQQFNLGMFFIVAFFIWASSPPRAAHAAACNSTASGSWNTVGIWSCGHVPLAVDDVTIATGHTVTVNISPITILSLTVNGTLNLNTANTSRTMTVSNVVTINNGGLLTLGDGSGPRTHTLNIGGNFVNNGTFTGANGDDFITVVFNGTSSQTLSGTGINNFRQMLVDNSGVANNNIVEITATNFTPAAGFLGLKNGILKVSGSFTLSNVFFDTAAYTIPATGGIWLNNPNVTVTAQNQNIILDGLLQITAGTYNIGTGSNNDLRYNSGAIFIMEGGALNIGGKFRGDTATIDTVAFSMSGGTLTAPINGNSESNIGSFDIGATGSSFTMSGGTIVIREENTDGTPLDYRNVASSVNITGGTVQFGTNTSPASETYEIGATSDIIVKLPNVVLNQTNPPTARLTRSTNIIGNLTINSGTTFNANSWALNITGDWINNGTFTSGTQTTTFNGTTPQTISGTSATGFSTLVVNSGATVIVPNTNMPTVAATMTNNGTLQQTRPVNNANVPFLTISTDRYRGVDINSTANLGNVTVRIQHVTSQTCTDTGAGSPAYALRCYQITPTTSGAAQVTLWALTSEQNSVPTNTLAPYRFIPGSGWTVLTGITNGTDSNGYVFGRGSATGFSAFLLANTNSTPTAVSLNHITAATVTNWLIISLVGSLLLLSVRQWRKQRVGLAEPS